MRRLFSIEDENRGYVTYAFPNGERVRMDRLDLEEFGITEILAREGLLHLMTADRLPVILDGRRVGTMPSFFDPLVSASSSPLYDPRPEDFVRAGETWVASPKLGMGDLECVVGFRHD